MTDIIGAPYFDRVFYKILNSLNGGLKGGEYLTLNPLKWSVMSFIYLTAHLFVYLVLLPFAMVPLSFIDAYNMKYIEYEGGNSGVYIENVYLIRKLK